jgi:hypothetical protein
MTASEYELLKCEDCGKTLGYIYVTVKTIPPKTLYRLAYGFPYQKIEKSAFCEQCFQRRTAQT